MKIADIEAELLHYVGSDLTVANAARVSFHKTAEWINADEEYADFADGIYRGKHPTFKGIISEKDEKLIRYLAKHKHHSPFNHAFLTFRVKAPIFVARQLVKHKFMPWNEVSRRYVDEEPEFYFPEYWRAKADNVKQGSSDEEVKNPRVDAYITESCLMGLNAYNALLRQGVAPEQARMVLPQNTMTEWWWSGTLGAYGDMLKLRLDPHTQYESRIVAQKIRDQIEPLFPVALKAMLEN